MATVQQLENLRNHFNSGITKPYQFRKEQLKKLKQSIILHEQELYDALYKDLKKRDRKSVV